MSEARITLHTWRGSRKFQYEGSVLQGTKIYFGLRFSNTVTVTANQYRELLASFSDREVSIGTSHTDPPRGSLGKWLQDEHKKYGITSYVGPILIKEGFAERAPEPDRIQINPFSK